MTSSSYAVRPGAEPLSHKGSDDVGVLVLHGFTGSPQTMRLVADALVAAGWSVELPRLPGHGTDVEEMLTTTFDDWSAVVESTFVDLASRVRSVVVVGLSMGGTLAAWVVARHPSEVAGAVFINAAVAPIDPAMLELVDQMIEAGETVAPGVGSDIADPDASEDAYEGTPLVPLKSLAAAVLDLEPRLGSITCPVLIMTSPNDHVVEPKASDLLAEAVGGPVERVTLERSFHVATLDYDKQLVIDRTIEFVQRVTSGS
jgi:carboxylesterase